MIENASISGSQSCFDEDAADVLCRLRGAIAEVIEALPGPITTASDLQKALRIDKMICWKLFQILTAGGPLAAGTHVPGPAGLRRFLEATEQVGNVPDRLIRTAISRAEEFERLVSVHAGDRATFNSMASALAGCDAAEHLDLQHRRAAFKANRHLWGVQAKTQLKTMFLQPSDDPALLDIATLEGFLDLRLLRHDAPLPVAWARTANDDGTLVHCEREPLAPDTEGTLGVALLKEFSSKPTPQFRIIKAEGGFVLGELIGRGLGKTAAVTCVTGHIARGAVPRHRDDSNKYGECWAMVRTACEVLVLDLVVREGTFGDAMPRAAVYGEHLNETAYPGRTREADRIPPLRAPVVYLGKGIPVIRTPDVPNYSGMAQLAFDRMGADGDMFDVYRCRIEYPVMPSTVLIRVDLLESLIL